nr:uncharacterized protein LOC119179728 isoform X2 [Rhipicephalus microplus]
MLTRNLRFLATLLFVCTALPLNTADSSCTTESLPSFMNLDTCFVIPEDLCTNPDMLMPFTESLISCGLAAIADLELPSKLYLVEGIVVNLLKNFGLGKITSAAFGVCKAMGGILDTLDNLSLGILGNVIEPVKKLMSLLPLPDCSANSIKGTVKCGSRISVKLPSSLNAKEGPGCRRKNTEEKFPKSCRIRNASQSLHGCIQKDKICSECVQLHCARHAMLSTTSILFKMFYKLKMYFDSVSAAYA